MDDNVVDAPSAAASTEAAVISIDGVEAVALSSVIARLQLEYPHVAAVRLEAIVLREWEAFSAGRPLIVPLAVEDGVREILDQR